MMNNLAIKQQGHAPEAAVPAVAPKSLTQEKRRVEETHLKWEVASNRSKKGQNKRRIKPFWKRIGDPRVNHIVGEPQINCLYKIGSISLAKSKPKLTKMA